MRCHRHLLILLIVLLPAGPFATTFPVTKTDDTNDGTCDADCSLREAIEAGNANPGADDVPIPAGTYLLTLGQLVVSDDLTLAGAGQADTILDGNASDRVFEIQYGVVAEISGVTFQNGNQDWGGGGGILNDGDLTLTNSTVSGNTTYPHNGGGINNSGYLTLTNSTVSGNTAFYPYYSGVGGGILNVGYVALTNTTVSWNIAGYGGGGLENRADLTLANTILYNNSALGEGCPNCGNCRGGVTSLGYNLEDGTSCGLTATGDIVVAEAVLGPLQDNGGPTETHDLLTGSPAIDAGSSGCPPPATDQRGVARPQGTACDIGAVEYVPEPHHATMIVAGAAFLGLLYRRRARD